MISAVLFFISLTGAGLALGFFFATLPRLFTQTMPLKVLSWLGSTAGIISGLSYIGVAFTPANLYLDAHVSFVYWAFSAFPVAAVFYTVAIALNRAYPKRYAAAFAVFALMLGGYLWLLFFGPSSTPAALRIQVTGQKLIVYAAIISIIIQAEGAHRVTQTLAREMETA